MANSEDVLHQYAARLLAGGSSRQDDAALMERLAAAIRELRESIEVQDEVDAIRLARIAELERMVIWALEFSGVVELEETMGRLWIGRDKYVEHDGTPASILAAVEKAMGDA